MCTLNVVYNVVGDAYYNVAGDAYCISLQNTCTYPNTHKHMRSHVHLFMQSSIHTHMYNYYATPPPSV